MSKVTLFLSWSWPMLEPRPISWWGLDTILSFAVSLRWTLATQASRCYCIPRYAMFIHLYLTSFRFPRVLSWIMIHLARAPTLYLDPSSTVPFPPCISKLRLGRDLKKRKLWSIWSCPFLMLSASIAWKQFPFYRVTSLKYQHWSEPTVLKRYPCLSRQMGCKWG